MVKAPVVTREPNRARADAIFMVGVSWILCGVGEKGGGRRFLIFCVQLMMLTSRKILANQSKHNSSQRRK